MPISLLEQAATTPEIRAATQASREPIWGVAKRCGVSEQTVGNGGVAATFTTEATRRIGCRRP